MEDKYQNGKGGHIKHVAFFGDANISEEDPTYKDAFEIAKMLATNGYSIVNGGGPGVMNASTSGAQAANGKTLTVTFDPQNAPGYEGRYVKNVPDKEIKTTNYVERMFKLLKQADLFLIFKGGSGTISELGTAWVLAKLYYGHHKPFILFGSHWIEIIDTFKRNMNLDKEEMAVFEIVEKKEGVLSAIEMFEKKIGNYNHDKDCKVCKDRAFRK